MPSATDRVTFEGKRTTRRTALMVQAARADFKRRTGQNGPPISQGGYNSGGVAASAGTHDRDALDFRTAGFTANACREWEASLGRVGFAAWWRPYRFNVWPQHHHAVPKGGDISRGARNQVTSYMGGRDGLAGNRSYPRIRPFRYVTWESYSRTAAPKPVPAGYVRIGTTVQKDLVRMSVGTTNRNRLLKTRHARETWYVQKWLKAVGMYAGPLDGRWGPVTQAGLDKFRRSRKWAPKDCVGPVGIDSLTLLRDAAKSRKPVVK